MKKLLLATALLSSSFVQAEIHKLAIQVNSADPATMNMALNNAQNVKSYFESQGDSAQVEIVAYGPGLKMYLEGSPVADRLATLGMDDTYSFSACGNTYKKMSAKAGKDLTLVSEAHIVPAGVVRLMELQNEGYSYIRP